MLDAGLISASLATRRLTQRLSIRELEMVIYHTAPIRCFPLLADEMASQFANAYHFRMPFEALDISDHRFGMLNNVFAYDYSLRELPRKSLPNNGFPHHILDNGVDLVEPARLADIDFLYGVFDGRLISRRAGDFVFTIISHPVRHVYDLFQYITFMTRNSNEGSRRSEGIVHFEETVRAGMCRFVDRFIDGDRSIEIGGRTFYLIEDFFRFNLDVDYDFVGAESQIERAISTLSDRLGISITGSERLLSRRSSLASATDYRYNDLCSSLRTQLEKYEAVMAL